MTTDTEAHQYLLVTNVHREADGVVSVTLEDPEGAPVAEWSPGAHLELVLPSGLVRQYSLCSDPTEKSSYTVAVLREENGRGGSCEIHDIGMVGRILEVNGPRNRFELVDSPSYLFIAGGIGITPILAMVREAAAKGSAWTLVYGGRTRGSMAFRAELETLATASPNGSVLFVPQDESGMLDLPGALAEIGPDTQIYCCGPAGLLSAVELEAAAVGAADRLHIERFGVDAKALEEVIAAAGPDSPFEVELRRTGTTLTVEPGESILETVRTVLDDVPSSCEEGFCGTCETRVLAGEVDHRDQILTDSEKAANETMFICVSRSRSAKLVLDL